MNRIIAELKQRNKLLYWFGWFNVIAGLICLWGMPFDSTQLLGVNRWLKPMKFYFSVGIMSWTMGWIMYHLTNTRKVKTFSLLIVFTMALENGLIVLQAIRKTTSHFNISSIFNAVIFQVMGITIFIFTITCLLITIAFFIQKSFQIPNAYLWGIRLGLVLFIISSIIGGMMISHFGHTVGAADGTEGIAIVNWSKNYGDLRVAHFVGLHALQVLPLAGWYIAKNQQQLFMIAAVYFGLFMFLLIQALKGIPVFF